ncbi:bacteriophage protein [Salmonella enterica subsp. enterica serovar Choleraesuis]|nr:bacteriophage protein [Salmonella enterica subsp. enterica serovar Choleraesuis]
MTANTSDQAGYLAPVDTSPAYDEALEREISRWIRAVSGLPDKMAIPRWTDPQPQIPAQGTNWCGFGIVDIQADDTPAIVSAGADADQQWRHETIVVLCCFYGPAGQATVTQFRDGLMVAQNNAELNRTTLTYLDCSRITPAPELINNQWVRRYDINVTLRRKTVRSYGIRSLASAPVKFFGE